MALSEKLAKKEAAFKEKITKKSQEAEGGEAAEIDSMEWLILFMGAGYIDILFIILTVIGLIPAIGQVIYVILDPILNMGAMGIFWFYLQHKGLGHYWWLAFGGGIADLIPLVNWIGWIIAVLILYALVKAEKNSLVGEKNIKKAAQLASKIK